MIVRLMPLSCSHPVNPVAYPVYPVMAAILLSPLKRILYRQQMTNLFMMLAFLKFSR